MKKQRGITLIALVITIVVLIILAGVAINLTLGENGIFKRAEEAKLQYEIAQAKEELDLKIAELQVEKQGTATLQDVVDMMKDENMNYVVSLEEITSITGVETIGDANEIYVVYKIYQFKIYNTLETEFISIVDYDEDVTTEKYTVTLNGENVTSNGANTVKENETYTATLTANGYNITGITVKMSGNTLTSGTDYTYENGSLTIPNVTGSIEITVVTEIIVSVTELTSYDQTGTLLTYSWEELEEVANVISNNPSIITKEDSMGARVTIGINTYEVKVGNLVAVKYNNETYNVKIVGFNHDTLASDTTKKAGISFVFEDIIKKAKMNSTDTNTTGWGGCELRTEVNNITLKTTAGADLPIKEVNKTYLKGNGSTTTATSNDKLWLLSCSEIWTQPRSGYSCVVGMAAGTEGEQYKYYKEIIGDMNAGTNKEELIKYYTENSTETADNWWLRSPTYYNDKSFCTGCGIANSFGASNSYGVVPGFSI